MAADAGRQGDLQVAPNRRTLQFADGKPFFYLGDTAWELFHRLNREEANRYLEDRARKGFTVIQASALAEIDGSDGPERLWRPAAERQGSVAAERGLLVAGARSRGETHQHARPTSGQLTKSSS